MWKVALVVVLLGGVAAADESLLDHQTRIASDAAKHGHCDVVDSIGAQVSAADADYHASTFSTDPAIAACMSGNPPKPPPATPITVQTAMPTGRPPLSGGDVFLEAFTGVISGGTGAVVGGAAGLGLASTRGCIEDGCYAGLIFGGLVGWTVGAATGVYLVGARGNRTGSALATYGGATLGLVVGGGLAIANHNSMFPVFSFTVMPIAGALIGFNATRRYESVQVAPVVTGNSVGLAGTF
jgi:hypothetical protein